MMTPETRGRLKHAITWGAYKALRNGASRDEVFNRIVDLQVAFVGKGESTFTAWLDGLSSGVLAGSSDA